MSAEAQRQPSFEVLIFIFFSQILDCEVGTIFVFKAIEGSGGFPIITLLSMFVGILIFPMHYEPHATGFKGFCCVVQKGKLVSQRLVFFGLILQLLVGFFDCLKSQFGWANQR